MLLKICTRNGNTKTKFVLRESEMEMGEIYVFTMRKKYRLLNFSTKLCILLANRMNYDQIK